MLKRIKYVSRQAEPLTRPEVDALVDASSRANSALGISGALVVAGNVFFQILEGPPAEVDALFTKIASDPRHTDVVCLTVQLDREVRLFPQWGMKRAASLTSPAAVTMEAIVRQLAMTDGPQRERMANDLARLMASELRAA